MNSDLRTKGNIPLALGMNPTPKPNTTKICPTPFDPKTIDAKVGIQVRVQVGCGHVVCGGSEKD